MLASSAVDHGFEPRKGKTKDYKIGICWFSTKHAALRRKKYTTVNNIQKQILPSNKLFGKTFYPVYN
jgi:hypothetical protein